MGKEEYLPKFGNNDVEMDPVLLLRDEQLQIDIPIIFTEGGFIRQMDNNNLPEFVSRRIERQTAIPIKKHDIASISALRRRVDLPIGTIYIIPKDTLQYYYTEDGEKYEIPDEEDDVLEEVKNIVFPEINPAYRQNVTSENRSSYMDHFFISLLHMQQKNERSRPAVVSLEKKTEEIQTVQNPVSQEVIVQSYTSFPYVEPVVSDPSQKMHREQSSQAKDWSGLRKFLQEKKVPKLAQEHIITSCLSLVQSFNEGVLFINGRAIPFEKFAQDLDIPVFLEAYGNAFNYLEFNSGSSFHSLLKDVPSESIYTVNKGMIVWIAERDMARHWILQEKESSFDFLLRENKRIMLPKKTSYLGAAANYLEEEFKKDGVMTELHTAKISRYLLTSQCFRKSIITAARKFDLPESTKRSDYRY